MTPHVTSVLGLANLQGFYGLIFSFFKFFLLLRIVLYDLRPVMPEKYCSKCLKKLDFSFFVKDKSTIYTPTAQIYATCYICREKQTLKRKRQATVSVPSLYPLPQISTPLPRSITPILG